LEGLATNEFAELKNNCHLSKEKIAACTAR